MIDYWGKAQLSIFLISILSPANGVALGGRSGVSLWGENRSEFHLGSNYVFCSFWNRGIKVIHL